MLAKKGQSSAEYVLLLSALLIMLVGIYELSIDMNMRRDLIQSRLEGQRVAFLVARAIDNVYVQGPGANETIFVDASPNQTIIFSGPEVIALGLENRTIMGARAIVALSNGSMMFQSGQSIIVKNFGSNISIIELG